MLYGCERSKYLKGVYGLKEYNILHDYIIYVNAKTVFLKFNDIIILIITKDGLWPLR